MQSPTPSETPRRFTTITVHEVYHKVYHKVYEEIIPYPDVSHLITETDEPVDNLFSANQQRLLVETLYSSAAVWNPDGRPFFANANVGLYISNKHTPIVPDVFLSMDVGFPLNEANEFDYNAVRTYFVWDFGKAPDVAIEIVSNLKGGEMNRKMREYAWLHIPYYVVFDPFGVLSKKTSTTGVVAPFQLYELRASSYEPMSDFWMNDLNLGLRLWEGEYENSHTTWLRWCDSRGNILPTGKERADSESQRADRLSEYLRTIGVDPSTI
jgi:Uma2 family endonuclease